MADLQLNIRATDQASPAIRQVGGALKSVGDEADKATTKGTKSTTSLGGSLLKMAAAAGIATGAYQLLSKVVSAGIQDILDSERAALKMDAALKQVGQGASAFKDAFEAQADAIEKSTLYTAEQASELQTLLLRLGFAPAQIERTTEALLDYSAATGKDATSSAMALARALQSDEEEMRALGITMSLTGDTTKDLDAAVTALSNNFSGAAKASASGLEGSIDTLKTAFDDVSGAIAKAVTNTTIFQYGLMHLKRESQKMVGFVNWVFGQEAEAAAAAAAAPSGGGFVGPAIPGLELAKRRADAAASARGASDEGAKAAARAADAERKRQEEMSKAWREANQKAVLSKIQAEEDEAEQIRRVRQQLARDLSDADARAAEERLAAERKASSDRKAIMEAEAAQLQAQNAAMEQAGIAVGEAFIYALGDQFAALKAGGEMDAGAMLKSLIPMIIQSVLMSNPATAAFAGLVGGATRVLLGTFHDGGWVGGAPKRYHSGGLAPDEVPAILQQGERVLSRAEVDAMGGPGGVERTVRGGGGGAVVHLNLQTFDARSFEDYMGERGGSAMVRTILNGRGEVAQLMRRNRRR